MIKVLVTKGERLTDFRERLEKVAVRADEMIHKENNILLPLCLRNFNEADWMRIYYEIFLITTHSCLMVRQVGRCRRKAKSLRLWGGKTVAERQAEGLSLAAALERLMKKAM